MLRLNRKMMASTDLHRPAGFVGFLLRSPQDIRFRRVHIQEEV